MSREEWEQVRASMTIFTAEEIKRAAAFNDAITLLKRTWQDLRTIVAIEFFPFLQKGIDGLRDFIRKQLPELKNGARAVAQYLEFGTRSLIEFVKLWHHLLSDRDSTRALGEVMRLTGKLALDTAETALKGLIEIVIRAGSFLLVPLRELGIELGGELALGLVRGLAKLPAKLAGLAAEWTKALANKVGPLGPVGSAFRAMVNELAEIGSLQSTAVQMAIDQILPATPQQELIDRFGWPGKRPRKHSEMNGAKRWAWAGTCSES
jgi:hypothetical protein